MTSNTAGRLVRAASIFVTALVWCAGTEAQVCAGKRTIVTDGATSVFNGSKAEKRYWPFVATLRISAGDGQKRSFCGGTVIAPDTVMTAAPCVALFKKGPDGRFRAEAGHQEIVLADVLIGVDNLLASNLDKSAYGITSIQVHDGFLDELTELSEAGIANAVARSVSDLALVRLSKTWQGPLAQVLPDPETEAKLALGHPGFVAGFGIFSIIDGVAQPSTILCEGLVRISKTASCPGNSDDFENRLCAAPGTNTNACNGDSGGPLMVYDPLTGCPSQAGVVSFRTTKAYETCGTKLAWFTRLAFPVNRAWLVKTVPLQK